MEENYAIELQVVKDSRTCGVVTISEYGRNTVADEWHGEPLDKFVRMCNKQGLKVQSHWRSSVGNLYIVWA